MKCDELKVETIVPQGCTITLQMYPKAEVDAAIAELKARIQLDDDEMAGFLQLEEECGGGDLRKYIAELKQKLEDAKASHYAEMVDAGMRERRLKRALWLARAERAKDRATTCNDFAYLGDTEREINMTLARTWMKCRMLKPSEWSKVWNNVERKCRAKAEECK